MIDDIVVFDNVVHVYDLSDGNILETEPTARIGRDSIADQNAALRVPENQGYGMKKQFTIEEIHDLVFDQGGVDLAMVQSVPIYEWFHTWFAPVETQYAMAKKYPGQVLFCGGVDPLYKGLDYALNQIDVQAQEMGARSFKFYNAHVNGSWACDDKEIAYPLFERCARNGVTTLQFHKGAPFGQQDLEPLNPLDLQRPARDFPELNFLIHHLAVPYFDYAANMAMRFPNIYLIASGVFNMSVFAPRTVQTWLGRLLAEVGVDKIIWGSESPLQGNPRPYLRHFMELEIPEDLQRDYGMPQVTHEDKRKILGGNFARLMGVDLEEIKDRKLAGQAVKAEATGQPA